MLLSGCAALNSYVEKPQVSVTNFKIVPGGSINPTFEIGLRVINPNAFALNLQGMAYSASIEGIEVFSGVANQLPSIPAYGEGDISIEAQADLFGGFRLLADLLKPRDKPITYQLQVKLDVGALSLPIYITREGNLNLPATR